MQIIIIGRGHSATRVPMAMLHESGVYVGNVSPSFDLLPAGAMYEAACMAGDWVKWIAPHTWDFSELLMRNPPNRFVALVDEYLSGFIGQDTYAWKLPEAALALPWLVKLFPDAYFIHWVRDGRDCILKPHGTDNLRQWHIPTEITLGTDRQIRAAISWEYHEELITQTPKPAHWLTIRLCDMVLDRDGQARRMSAFLGFPVNPIPMFTDVVGRWRGQSLNGAIEIMRPQLEQHGFMEVG